MQRRALHAGWRGDLVTPLASAAALTDGDLVGAAIAAEDLPNYAALSPMMAMSIQHRAERAPRTPALMHGFSFSSDGAAALRARADDHDPRVAALGPATKS